MSLQQRRLSTIELFVQPRKLSNSDMALLPSPTNWLHAFPPSPSNNTRSDSTSTSSSASVQATASSRSSSSSYPRTRYQVGHSSHDSLASAVEALMRQDTEYNQATTTTTAVDKGAVVSPISFARVTLPDVAGAQSTLRMGSTTTSSLDRGGLRVVGSASDATESSCCTRKGRFEVRRL
ncbi:hypothetical protein BJ741DRAFT_632712 [Chytriomyces cf. hyalinus JEL632]|nr:hypothetical protein BJ741DRAFT_632712 [Chytriomyces cf. hyalinus JEL632]